MRGSSKIFAVVGVLGAAIVVAFSSSVTAMRFSSTDYIIDAAVLNNVGGYTSSTNYQLTSSGGEAAIGNGSSGSYKLAAGYVAQIITPAITVKTQPTGLAAYYPLDENSGTVAHDSSSNASLGTFDGSSAWYTPGQIGTAVDIGGTGDIHVPYSSALPGGTGLTIEAWIKRASLANGQCAIVTQWDYTGGTNHGGTWALQTTPDSTGLRFFVATDVNDPGNNYVDTGSGLLTTSTWQHVVVTYDGTQPAGSMVKFYVNGVQQAGTVYGTLPGTLNTVKPDLYIGDFHGLNRHLNGAIDQLKIFNRALSSAEVSAEYSAQNAGVETGLTLQTITPGASNTSNFNVITLTSGSSYNLAINENHDLQNGSYTIPAMSGTIASPGAWAEGTTKGLGFTLTSTNATPISASWNSGSSYAGIPTTATTFYTRTGTQSSKDILGVQLRADAATTQASGAYSNTMTITGTANP